MRGTQARRGSLGANSAPMSSAETCLIASATSARPAGVSRRSPGSVSAVLSRSLRWKTRSIATAASTRVGPLTRAIKAATTSPTPPAIANGNQSGPGRECPTPFSTAITTATTASAAPQLQTAAARNR